MAPSLPQEFFRSWLNFTETTTRRNKKVLIRELPNARAQVFDRILEVVRSHYLDQQVLADRLAELGVRKTARLIREQYPETKKARSGDLGEILAIEYAIRQMGYRVPILRLRWKDGRNMALRGDDVVGLAVRSGRVQFLKGESKSRQTISQAVIDEAANALVRNDGRPSRHAMLFVANRLRETGDPQTALIFEKALLEGINRTAVEHCLFTFSGNDPDPYLSAHLANYSGAMGLNVVGLKIDDHGEFIRTVYERCNARAGSRPSTATS